MQFELSREQDFVRKMVREFEKENKMAGGNVCGDNRFEIIARAKQAILDSTNIDTSPDEMKVLDNFLFRCWQMDWLDKYDENKRLVEQKQGQWEILTNEYDCEYMMCSICGEEFYPVVEDTVDIIYNYCPNCGAKMLKGTEE